MIVSVVPIGNSKGVRLPKAILDQLEITDKLDLQVENQQIILKPVKESPRAGWADAFRSIGERGEDALLVSDVFDDESFEWEW